MPRVVESVPLSDGFLPDIQQAASLRDLRNTALHREMPLNEVFPEEFNAIMHGVAMERKRHDAEPFGIYDGVLSEFQLIEALTQKYGPDHLFSVNQLERYLKCPFLFFVECVLHLEAVEAPEAEFDPKVAGSILHDTLQRFHERFRGIAIPDIPPEEARTALVEALNETFRTNTTASRGAAMAEKLRMQAALLRYLHIEQEKDDTYWKPMNFEVAFGRDRGRSTDTLTTPEPFVMESEVGPLRFSGRIDRLDRSEPQVRIIDYKSNTTPLPGEITSGKSIQLSLYAWAVEQLLIPGSACSEAWYLPVGKSKYQEALGKKRPRDGWPQREETARNAIVAGGAWHPRRPVPAHTH